MDHRRQHELIHETMRFFVREGDPIIPLCPHDHEGMPQSHKGFCPSPGKRPLLKKWQEGVYPDEETLEGWLEQWPNCNVGLVLGLVSGIVGIDVDGTSGEVTLQEWSGGDLPPTNEFTTPGGGRRLLYKVPDSVRDSGIEKLGNPAAQNRAANHEECRLLGCGRQTVLPPSIHPNGGVYEWKQGHLPGEMDCADMPQWMIDMMTANAVAPEEVAAEQAPRPASTSKPLDLDADAALARLSEKCPRFREDWAAQQGAGVDYDTWFHWISLLTTAGFKDAAAAFSRASKKHDRMSEGTLRDIARKAAAKETFGMTRCTTFGCDLAQVTACFTEPRTNDRGQVTNSPGRFLFGGGDRDGAKGAPALTPEAAKAAAEAAAAKVEAGDAAAHLEPDALRAFAALKQGNLADYTRLRDRLKAAKVSVSALDWEDRGHEFAPVLVEDWGGHVRVTAGG